VNGSTFKRCSCPATYDARGRRKACSTRHGSWYYVAELDAGPGGARRQLKRGGFRTQADAAAALAEVLAEVEAGQYHDDGRMTVAAYLRGWLEDKLAAGLRPTTARSYRQHIEDYLVPYLGHHRLGDLRPVHVSRMLSDVAKSNATRARKIGPTTIRRVHATLRSALTDAVRHELVRRNAAKDARVPKAVRPKVHPWEPVELGAFLDHAAAHRLGSFFELVALAGLRRGEALGLRWSDVDLERGFLVVRQQVVQLDADLDPEPCPSCGQAHRGLAFGAPKTASGEARRVDLGDRGIGTLLAHRLVQDAERAVLGVAYVDHGLVFARETGAPIAPESATKTFGRLVIEARLRPVRLHDLRHGRASLMLAAGVPLAVVSKMLGHLSITITSDTYSHLLEGVGRAAADAADALVPIRRTAPQLRDQSVTTTPLETTQRPRLEDESAGQKRAPRGT